MSETKTPQLQFIAGVEGVTIPLRVWDPPETHPPLAPVVMIHGLQSHSGWFTASAEFIARQGAPVYAFDRRGSGLSTLPRGHCHNFREMIDDICSVVDYACVAHGARQVHILGHCFGAIPAIIFGCLHPDRTQSLMLASPGLYTHAGLPFRDIIRVFYALASKPETPIRIPLEPSWFSEFDQYTDFIEQDPLSLRRATASLFYEVQKARRFIRRRTSVISMPFLMMCAGKDRISDNAKNRRFFEGIPSADKTLIEYERAKHILEFSSHRNEFLEDLAWWIRRRKATLQ
jgi:acylglycerol lipase